MTGPRIATLVALSLSLLAGCQRDAGAGLSPERVGPQVLNPVAETPL